MDYNLYGLCMDYFYRLVWTLYGLFLSTCMDFELYEFRIVFMDYNLNVPRCECDECYIYIDDFCEKLYIN